MKYLKLAFNQRDNLIYERKKTDCMLPKTVPLGTVKKGKLKGRKISYTKDENEAEPLQELW